jgi:hypothetical protein
MAAARGHFVIVMDADNTYPADTIPRMIELGVRYIGMFGVLGSTVAFQLVVFGKAAALFMWSSKVPGRAAGYWPWTAGRAPGGIWTCMNAMSEAS